MKKKVVPYLLLVPQIVLIIIFLIGLITGITQSFGVIPAFGLREPTLKYYKEILMKPELFQSVSYSLKIAFLSAAIATAGGVILAGLCVSVRQTSGLMMRIIQMPIIVPHVVVAIFAVNICSQNGILARIGYALGLISDQQQFPLIIYDAHGFGIILAYVWKELPFIVYFVIALMANINGKLGEAARNLGAGKICTFVKVTLPLCKETIISGFLIIFVFALGAYELPFLLGATTPKALPILAYQQYIHPNLENRPYAMALNGVIICISMVSAVLYFVMLKKNVSYLAGKNHEEKKKINTWLYYYFNRGVSDLISGCNDDTLGIYRTLGMAGSVSTGVFYACAGSNFGERDRIKCGVCFQCRNFGCCSIIFGSRCADDGSCGCTL